MTGAKRQWDWKNVSINKEIYLVPEKKQKLNMNRREKRTKSLSGMSRKLSTWQEKKTLLPYVGRTPLLLKVTRVDGIIQ